MPVMQGQVMWLMNNITPGLAKEMFPHTCCSRTVLAVISTCTGTQHAPGCV